MINFISRYVIDVKFSSKKRGINLYGDAILLLIQERCCKMDNEIIY